ncbi:MAG: hypothetical protein LBM98_04345 [Oscillospiraceae bacterium]|nr:hypothetical protein [Oscillospiraceae bacterium]
MGIVPYRASMYRKCAVPAHPAHGAGRAGLKPAPTNVYNLTSRGQYYCKRR